MDLSHHTIPSCNGRCTSGGNRTLAGGSRAMARTARLFPGFDRDAQLHPGLFLWGERLDAPPPRLQRKHSWRLSSGAADVELCDSKRDSFPKQKARIYTRARPAADPGHADGLIGKGIQGMPIKPKVSDVPSLGSQGSRLQNNRCQWD
jgi:hypothetical protein